jgi:hypothetical protein
MKGTAMAYFTTELAVPPPVTVGGAVIQQKAGTGYPTGAPGTAYYPNSPAIPPVANNSHGVANSPDEYPAVGTPPASIRYAYSWQTFEEKIAATVPPGVPVVPV